MEAATEAEGKGETAEVVTPHVPETHVTEVSGHTTETSMLGPRDELLDDAGSLCRRRLK
jgi:hypothetical protein